MQDKEKAPQGAGLIGRNWRMSRIDDAFVHLAQAALSEANGSVSLAQSNLYKIAREKPEHFGLAERARLALYLLTVPDASELSVRSVLERKIAEMERLSHGSLKPA